MALLIGSLSRENDPAVLNAIAEGVITNPEKAVDPLISENKTSAVLFARAAGEYSGLSVLHIKQAKSFMQDEWHQISKVGDDATKGDVTIGDLAAIVIRAGSPFEATAKLNQQFPARDFLTNRKGCPFYAIFSHQQSLSMGSGLTDVTRTSPPSAKDVQLAIARVISTATALESSSHILGKLAAEKWDVLKSEDLYGTAVIIGEYTPEVVNDLRSRGAYVSFGDNGKNPGCKILS